MVYFKKMKPKTRDLLLILIILVLAAFVLRFWYTAKELMSTSKQLKDSQTQLISEKQAKGMLQSQLEQMDEELADVNGQLEQVKQQLGVAQNNNAQLLAAKNELEQKVATLQQEKQDIEAKLHSLRELKKFIRQVRIELHNHRVQEYLARKQRQREIDVQELAKGNRGFLLKSGKSTYIPTVKIEVRPVN